MEEEKKGTGMAKVIVPIVAVALFSLVLFGAGYAYFAANIVATNVTNINATLPNATTNIVSTSTSCSFTVTPAQMVQSAVTTEEPETHLVQATYIVGIAT